MCSAVMHYFCVGDETLPVWVEVNLEKPQVSPNFLVCKTILKHFIF